MNLETAPIKTTLEIISINENSLIESAMRFGIECGEKIFIVDKFPGGPIIIQRSEQQIAIGRELAKQINVKIN